MSAVYEDLKGAESNVVREKIDIYVKRRNKIL